MFQQLGEGTDSPEPCAASTAGHQLLECCWPCQHLPADHSHKIKFTSCDIGEWCPFFSQPHSCAAASNWGWDGGSSHWVSPGQGGDGWDFKGTQKGLKTPLRDFRCKTGISFRLGGFSLSLVLPREGAQPVCKVPGVSLGWDAQEGFSAELPGQVGNTGNAESDKGFLHCWDPTGALEIQPCLGPWRAQQ